MVPFLWGAGIVSGLSALSLAAGITLLLGNLSHRKVGLPMIWISAALLAASVAALILMALNS
jgi:hypothetical protein